MTRPPLSISESIPGPRGAVAGPATTRLVALWFLATLLAMVSWPGLAAGGVEAEADTLVSDYIAAWKAFYPSRAFAYGDRDSAGAFEDFGGSRVDDWLALNDQTASAARSLLFADGLDLPTRTDLQVLLGQAIDERASWTEDEPLRRQPQWYAGRVSQALTHLLVRDQLSAQARRDALAVRLRGVARLCHLGVEKIENGNLARTQRALRTLAGTRAFYENGLLALLDTWPGSASGTDSPAVVDAALNDAITAIQALESHLEALLPTLNDPVAIGAERYTAKLSRRSNGRVTPAKLREDARKEMRRVRALMIEEARRWQATPRPGASVTADAPDDALLAAALDAMEADREDHQAAFLDQFVTLTRASERFVVDNRIATVPQPTTLYIALSPAHFSGAAVGGVYPSGPFDPQADTLFYIPSVPDDAPAEAREGFYRSFNDHFNAMIISHEMFPGHYLQYKVAVSEAPPVRSLFSNGAYTEGWGSFVEELLLDAGWAGNAPLTRLAHLRKRLENATRATVSVEVHTAGWDRERVLAFARDEGLLAPQFAENLWQRVVNSPLQITDYYVGWAQFKDLYAARGDGPLIDWVDAVLRAGPVPMDLLPPLLEP
jgi:hypothetical protein